MRLVARHSIPNKRANRQYVSIRDAELWKFIDSKRRIFVAFSMKNGEAHVSPVWFCVIDGKVYFRTYNYKVKTHLASFGRSCFSVDEGDSYTELKGVIVWGKSRVINANEDGLIRRINLVMDRRYEKQQWKESEMPAPWVSERKKEKRAYVEITPERASSWDNSRVKRNF